VNIFYQYFYIATFLLSMSVYVDVLELRETPFGDCGTGIEPQIQLLIAIDLVDQD
jgi:hypothetical protein